MAQIDITLNREEILQLFFENRDEALKILMTKVLNELLQAESEEQLGAGKSERSSSRTDYRNGTRERTLNTRIGSIELTVPRHRNEPFHTMIFESDSRSEASLIETMVEMVISGVSTRKVEKVVETLCGTSFSKSTVSELCKKLDSEVFNFTHRDLSYYCCPFLMVDATYFKVREDHKIVSKAFLTAIGFKYDGTKEVLGFEVHDAEDNYSWITFFQSLKERGLNSVKVIISDSHRAIKTAIRTVYPDAAWQRCQVHLTRNIIDATPTKYAVGIKTELKEMFEATSLENARKLKNELVKEYEDVAPKAVKILEDGFEDCMTVMSLPEKLRIVLRTTNTIESLNRQFKRRSDVIQIFPNSASVMRLIGSVAIEQSDEMQKKKKLYSEKTYVQISEILDKELAKTVQRQKAEFDAA